MIKAREATAQLAPAINGLADFLEQARRVRLRPAQLSGDRFGEAQRAMLR